MVKNFENKIFWHDGFIMIYIDKLARLFLLYLRVTLQESFGVPHMYILDILFVKYTSELRI